MPLPAAEPSARAEHPGAWFVAAGMLAAGNESTWQSAALGRLMVESARRWPGFADELGVPLPADGTLAVVLTADDLEQARREWARQGLTPSEVRQLEPALSPRVRAGCHLADDRQVDPRRVVAALRERVTVVPERVEDLAALDADRVIVAAGVGTAALTGLPVRPVKGELLRLRGEPGLLRHVISGYADGRHVYLVPRADGDVIVGATQQERTDHAVTAGAILDLLRAAVDLVPALADFAVTEMLAGHRPSTPDNEPLLGRLDDRTVVATGHHRNGVLLAPITADLIAELVVTGEADPLLAPFDPGRFS
ncbi:FAD-dependent oxidoreductase [Actinoplanes sp. NPDC051633]|uniref:FAD-dependent oxidoreductase n=1 Tax=Actinoplanes sp. NPDC051633 TaxID=3155670 RepID=UPI003422946E